MKECNWILLSLKLRCEAFWIFNLGFAFSVRELATPTIMQQFGNLSTFWVFDVCNMMNILFCISAIFIPRYWGTFVRYPIQFLNLTHLPEKIFVLNLIYDECYIQVISHTRIWSRRHKGSLCFDSVLQLLSHRRLRQRRLRPQELEVLSNSCSHSNSRSADCNVFT